MNNKNHVFDSVDDKDIFVLYSQCLVHGWFGDRYMVIGLLSPEYFDFNT